MPNRPATRPAAPGTHEPASASPLHAFAPLRLARKLRLNQLLIVDSVLQTHSFAVTAQRLGMTQSAITKAIQDLESFFDAKLFERTNRGVRPTELGLRMGEHTRVMLAEMRFMTDSLNALRLGDAGHVAIGTLTTASSRLLPDAIRALRIRHPNIGVSIVVGDRAQLYSYLVEGRIDIVIGAVPPASSGSNDQVAYQVLYEDALYVVAGSEHPLAGRRALGLHELQSYPWIIPPRESLVRVKIDRLFTSAGLQLPADLIESLSPITNMGLLMDQRSLGFMSAGLAQLFLTARLLVRLDVGERWSFGDVGYAIRASRPPSLATQSFIACLKEQVPPSPAP
ncbi:LysR family transcriptional regulator [Paraburkholderia sp. RL18-103-BIB-C]|jgi:DNA-binding transcriptional LysR family regulator|uniref:LysR family transcriptional regulator n=1 Tax=unclassified Paraburkholderia TaxID=2615204 RepID=UPI0038B6CE15